MANGLTVAKNPKVHQALHGYADGHRQLALSVVLKSHDRKNLLALSDISGPGAQVHEDGYLTGYPLPDSGYYALSRTWPAPEMSRPGCVWTHTLLIDFADLATLERLEGLSCVFQRPSGPNPAREYEGPRQISTDDISNPTATVSPNWARQVLGALYGKPSSRIIAMRPSRAADTAALSIWSQQWPRLRRSFRFCSFAISDRSAENASFDLQMLPSMDRHVRSRFANVVDADAVSVSDGDWLDSAVSDLLLPRENNLRSFLRRLGADVTGGREVFRPLCRLYGAVERIAVDPDALRDAIQILQDGLGSRQSNAACAIVAKAAFEHVELLDESSFEFLWDNLRFIEPGTMTAGAAKVGRIAWEKQPELLVAGQGDPAVNQVLDQTFAELSTKEISEGIAHAPGLLTPALTRRPGLLSEPRFFASLQDADGVFEAAKACKKEKAAILGLLSAGRADLARRAVREFGSLEVLDAVGTVSAGSTRRLTAWVSAAAKEPAAVAEFLLSCPKASRHMLYMLATVLGPDAVPSDYEVDPWLVAWRYPAPRLEGA